VLITLSNVDIPFAVDQIRDRGLQIEKNKVRSNWNDRVRFRTVHACAEGTVFKVGKSKLFVIAALEVYKWQRSLKKTV